MPVPVEWQRSMVLETFDRLPLIKLRTICHSRPKTNRQYTVFPDMSSTHDASYSHPSMIACLSDYIRSLRFIFALSAWLCCCFLFVLRFFVSFLIQFISGSVPVRPRLEVSLVDSTVRFSFLFHYSFPLVILILKYVRIYPFPLTFPPADCLVGQVGWFKFGMFLSLTVRSAFAQAGVLAVCGRLDGCVS